MKIESYPNTVKKLAKLGLRIVTRAEYEHNPCGIWADIEKFENK